MSGELVEITSLVQTYGYWLIFPVALVEGPILAVICGWLVALKVLNLFLVYVILAGANVLGDSLYYAVGYWGGTMAIKRWGRWLRLDLEQTVKLKSHFDSHGGKILLAAKIAPHFGTAPALAGAGLARYNFWLFLRYSVTIEIFKTAILLGIGYFAGDAYQKIATYFDYLGALVSALLALAIGIGFYCLRRNRRIIK